MSGLKQPQSLAWLAVALTAGLLAGCSGDSKVLDYVTPGKVPEVPALEPGVFPAHYPAISMWGFRSRQMMTVRLYEIGA